MTELKVLSKLHQQHSGLAAAAGGGSLLGRPPLLVAVAHVVHGD
jgi:hypothetical protein